MASGFFLAYGGGGGGGTNYGSGPRRIVERTIKQPYCFLVVLPWGKGVSALELHIIPKALLIVWPITLVVDRKWGICIPYLETP